MHSRKTDSPFKELVFEMVPKYAKDWLSFSSFLKQRRRILAEPQALIHPAKAEDGEKTAFGFLMQCMVFASLLSCLPPLLAWAILPARTDHENSSGSTYEKQIRDVEQRLGKDSPFDRVQDKDLLEELKNDAHYAYLRGVLASEPRVAYLVIAPMGFVFSAYLFSFTIFLQDRKTRPSTRIASIYILLVSAALFWLYVVQAICSGLDSTFYDFAWSDSSFDIASWISLCIRWLLYCVGVVVYIKACWTVARIIDFRTHRYLRIVQIFGTSCLAFIIGTAFAYGLGMGVVEVAARVTEALDRWKLSS
jgi:hypothetical protein